MRAEPEVHLDHAATSWPKAPGVAEAVARWFAELGVDPARGDGPRQAEVADAFARVRAALARMCGTGAERVAFSSGATESLNLFFRGLLREGDRVLTTATEHSSVVRPLVALRDPLGLELTVVPCDPHGRVDPDALARELADARPTRLVALNHASNVTGAAQDAATISSLAREHGALVLLDASQTAGALPIDVGADAVVASAHKSLLGPPGLGFLATSRDLELAPAKQGGTGSAIALERQPSDWPHAHEAGTPNSPAVLGLDAAMRWLAERDADRAGHGTLAAVDRLREALSARLGERVRFQSPADGPDRLPILSFVIEDLDPAEAGILLGEHGLAVRTGFHCAPWIHTALGTQDSGTIRVSPGPFVSEGDLLRVADVLAR